MASVVRRALRRIFAALWSWPLARLATIWSLVLHFFGRGLVPREIEQQPREGLSPSARLDPPYCGPTRILIDVKDNGTYSYQQAWDAPGTVVTRVLQFFGYDRLVSPDDTYNTADCRFIAVDRWDGRTFMVFDLYNNNYDFLEAHLDDKNDLPVIVARISKDRVKSKKIPQQIGMVNKQIRELHRCNGWEKRPPYKTDHANGAYPTYCGTRSTTKTPTTS